MVKAAMYTSVFFSFSVLLAADAGAQPRFHADAIERLNPGAAEIATKYSRDVYLELLRMQPLMVDKSNHERHRRNATMEVSFAVAKNGRVRSMKIARSSGDPELDKIVTGVIQSTQFTAPPPGANTDFLLPLSFRLN